MLLYNRCKWGYIKVYCFRIHFCIAHRIMVKCAPYISSVFHTKLNNLLYLMASVNKTTSHDVPFHNWMCKHANNEVSVHAMKHHTDTHIRTNWCITLVWCKKLQNYWVEPGSKTNTKILNIKHKAQSWDNYNYNVSVTQNTVFLSPLMIN